MSSGLQINDSVKAGWDNVRNGDNGGWLLLELDAAKKALTAQRWVLSPSRMLVFAYLKQVVRNLQQHIEYLRYCINMNKNYH